MHHMHYVSARCVQTPCIWDTELGRPGLLVNIPCDSPGSSWLHLSGTLSASSAHLFLHCPHLVAGTTSIDSPLVSPLVFLILFKLFSTQQSELKTYFTSCSLLQSPHLPGLCDRVGAWGTDSCRLDFPETSHICFPAGFSQWEVLVGDWRAARSKNPGYSCPGYSPSTSSKVST